MRSFATIVTGTMSAAALLIALSVPAAAYTAEQRIACMPDALRLCSAHIPDVTSITSCMRAKKDNLSSACKAVFDKPAANQSQASK